ncbi:TonB-dependent receptor domain-containing protein [Campylobacter corcagiensis]|uniref:TonB-dependent receptor n=1 Tax=Campylobacter corcagiensis TaxID=1448857 RepID=A0A7M1LHN6_9BACT|nr:TonB-dependent receptor [Campylobacter corcagiensis]QKF65321.1 TonB-dependent receptor [Campylobacter corcagiensis]QOQ88097.1 TonB-dependent receptor [Campylobacter corcagiensis]
MQKNRVVLSLAASFMLCANALAEDTVKLDTIEVSSTVANTQTVDAYKVNTRNAGLLKDVLRDIPGVYMGGTNGYNQKIYMRGMNDRALNITIDGARQKGNTFHHNADLLIDPAIIKAVDVGVGVHSVVGTSGAMGGSVAFKTVDASDLLEDGEIVGARINMGFASNNDEFSQGLTIYGSDEDRIFDALGYFNHRGYDFGKDGAGRAMGGDGDDYNYLLKLGVKTGDHGKLTGSYEHMEYKGIYPMKAEWPGGVDRNGKRILKDSKYTRDTFALNYDYNPNNYIDLNLNAYYTDHNLDMTKEDPSGINTGVKTWGIKAINKTNFQTGILDHTLVYGTEYYQTKAYNDSKSATSGNKFKTKTANDFGIKDDEVKSLSIFLEDQIRHGGLTFVPGIRFDKYELDTLGGKGSTYNASGKKLNGDIKGRSKYSWNEWSPALLLDYQTQFGLGGYISYAKLFRGPDVFEGIRINNVNATDTKYNEDLKPETGDTYEIGLRYSTDLSEVSSLSLSAKYFYTEYENLIGEFSTPSNPNAVRMNAGDARINGIELAAKFLYENLSLSASYSTQDTKYKNVPTVLSRGKKASGYGSGLAYSDIGDKITFNAEYFISSIDTFVGWNTIAFTSINEQKFEGEKGKVRKPGYAVHDIYATWVPNSGKFKGLEVNFGIYNIFDKTYASHSQRTLDFSSAEKSSIDFEEGRNVKFNVSYKF